MSPPTKKREGLSQSDGTMVRIPQDRHRRHLACHLQSHYDYHHIILSYDGLPVSIPAIQHINQRHQSHP